MTAEVDVFVINQRVGELIIIRFAPNRFGIIDCYDDDELPYIQHLIPDGATIEFMAVTHPHLDHLRNMGTLLRKRHGQIRRLWLYPGSGKKDVIAKYLSRPMSRGEDSSDPTWTRVGDELVALHKVINAHKYQWGANYQRLGNPMHHVLFSMGPAVELSAVAPPQQVVDKYEDFLNDPTLSIQDQSANGENLVSCVFLLRIGAKYLLFLSDVVNSRAWSNLLYQLQTKGISSNSIIYVKVSHHGSDNGYDNTFWKWLGQTEHVTITSFSHSKLPKPMMTAVYKRHAISCTVLGSSMDKPNPYATTIDKLLPVRPNCDHVSVDQTGSLRHELITIP